MVKNFKQEKAIIEDSTFFFIDNTSSLNARNRTYRFYEYTGLMKFAFGNETRYGARDYNIGDKELNSYLNYAQYNIRGYKLMPFQHNIFINYGTYSLTAINTLKLLYFKIFDPQKFAVRIKDIISLKATPYEP